VFAGDPTRLEAESFDAAHHDIEQLFGLDWTDEQWEAIRPKKK
jgi:hypothetical protein